MFGHPIHNLSRKCYGICETGPKWRSTVYTCQEYIWLGNYDKRLCKGIYDKNFSAQLIDRLHTYNQCPGRYGGI